MRTLNIHGFRIKIHFSIDRVKRIEIAIPDWADDVGLSLDYNKICYYKCSTKYTIELKPLLPINFKRIDLISIDKLYNADRTGFNTNRKVIIEVTY